jgi:putative alpha-1,2-mannosidase
MVGSGALDYGNVGIMATNTEPTSYLVTDYNFRSSFSHDDEEAKPGYYRVLLYDPNVMVELTRSALTLTIDIL